MEASPPYFDPRQLASLEGLELRARSVVDGYVTGAHRSPMHGFSIEFAEHREYVPGDDLRHVDWKVFGKTDKFYLKQYEEETNLVCYLVLDVSESMDYRGPGAAMSKLEYAQCLAASLGYLVLRQQDSVALATFDDELRAWVKPSGVPTQFKQITQIMRQSPGKRKSTTGALLHDLAERFIKRGIVVVLSDLFDDLTALEAGLKHLRHRRHDVIVMHTLDPAELEFPFQELTKFQGLEGWGEVLTDPRALRKAYLKQFELFLRQVERICRGLRIDYWQARTDLPLDRSLSAFLGWRGAVRR